MELPGSEKRADDERERPDQGQHVDARAYRDHDAGSQRLREGTSYALDRHGWHHGPETASGGKQRVVHRSEGQSKGEYPQIACESSITVLPVQQLPHLRGGEPDHDRHNPGKCEEWDQGDEECASEGVNFPGRQDARDGSDHALVESEYDETCRDREKGNCLEEGADRAGPNPRATMTSDTKLNRPKRTPPTKLSELRLASVETSTARPFEASRPSTSSSSASPSPDIRRGRMFRAGTDVSSRALELVSPWRAATRKG